MWFWSLYKWGSIWSGEGLKVNIFFFFFFWEGVPKSILSQIEGFPVWANRFWLSCWPISMAVQQQWIHYHGLQVKHLDMWPNEITGSPCLYGFALAPDEHFYANQMQIHGNDGRYLTLEYWNATELKRFTPPQPLHIFPPHLVNGGPWRVGKCFTFLKVKCPLSPWY